MMTLVLLLSVFPLRFALLNFRFRDRHNARRQSFELFKRRLLTLRFGFAHAEMLPSRLTKRKPTDTLLDGGKCHKYLSVANLYQYQKGCGSSLLVCDDRLRLLTFCNRPRTGRAPFLKAHPRFLSGLFYLIPRDASQPVCLTGLGSLPRSSACSLASSSANTSRKGRNDASFFAI